MAPELEKLAKRYGDAIDVLKLDTEAYPELASALVVRGYVNSACLSDLTVC